MCYSNMFCAMLGFVYLQKSGDPTNVIAVHYFSSFFVLLKASSVEYLKGGTAVLVLQGCCQEEILVAEL